MTFYIFLGATVVLFVVGITLILKGMREPSSDEAGVVPIADIKELRPNMGVQPQTPASSASVSQQVVTQNMKKPTPSTLAQSGTQKDEVAELRTRLETVLRDNHRLEEALRKEIEAKAVPQTPTDPAEVDQLKNNGAQMERQLRQNEEETERLRKILEDSRRDFQNEIVSLKSLLQQTQQERDRVRQEYLSQLSTQQDIATVQSKVQQLEQERNALQTKLAQYESELENYKKQLLEWQSKPPVVDTGALAEITSAIESIKVERDELLDAGRMQEKNIQKLKEFVAFLQEKEKMYQYELTKSRAQVLGLERICADYKQQTQPVNRVAVTK